MLTQPVSHISCTFFRGDFFILGGSRQLWHTYLLYRFLCMLFMIENRLWVIENTHVEKGSAVYFLVLDLKIKISNQMAERPINVTCIRSPRTLVVGGASHASRYCTVHRILRIWRLLDRASRQKLPDAPSPCGWSSWGRDYPPSSLLVWRGHIHER